MRKQSIAFAQLIKVL